MKIISHHQYWHTKNEIEKLEDADSRGLLTGPEYSHKGDLLEGSRHFLFQMKKAIAIYEQENPKK